MADIQEDPLKGYRGAARNKLLSHSVRVWSDVRLVNAAGSVFEGVILPRSGTFDDLHVVLKLKNGYNVGIHVDRITSIEELGYKEAVYKIPEKEFPTSPDLPAVTLLGTGGTIASRLDYRTGAVIPAFTPASSTALSRSSPTSATSPPKKIFDVSSVKTWPWPSTWPWPIASARDRSRRRRHRHRSWHRHHGSHGGGAQLHGPGLTGADRDRRQPAIVDGRPRTPALNLIHAVRCCGLRDIAEVQIRMFGTDSTVTDCSTVDSLLQDASVRPQHLPHHRRHSSRIVSHEPCSTTRRPLYSFRQRASCVHGSTTTESRSLTTHPA